jgi:hypothetical protein
MPISVEIMQARAAEWKGIPAERMIGERFGTLTVVEVYTSKDVVVECECGRRRVVARYDLVRGKRTSCGHHQRERSVIAAISRGTNGFHQRVEIDSDVARIQIENRPGAWALVDTVMLSILRAFSCKWRALGNGMGKDYVVGVPTVFGRPRTMLLHRVVMEEPAAIVDHKNGDTFDCRRDNLRPVSQSVNVMNILHARSHNRSGIRGVYRDKRLWCGRVSRQRTGGFADIRDAVESVWLNLLELDPVSATNYLRGLPVPTLESEVLNATLAS